jgi:hypothetical protein
MSTINIAKADDIDTFLKAGGLVLPEEEVCRLL